MKNTVQYITFNIVMKPELGGASKQNNLAKSTSFQIPCRQHVGENARLPTEGGGKPIQKICLELIFVLNLGTKRRL